jgi:hypothetical protein
VGSAIDSLYQLSRLDPIPSARLERLLLRTCEAQDAGSRRRHVPRPLARPSSSPDPSSPRQTCVREGRSVSNRALGREL